MVDIEDKKGATYNRCMTILAIGIIIFALLVLSTVFGVYWVHFGGLKISPNPGDWGPFGDYIGGTVNPILSFLTIVLLAFTIILQSRQLSISSKELRISRRELELARAELKRTAEAQELSEKTLRAQAEAADTNVKLAKINALSSITPKRSQNAKLPTSFQPPRILLNLSNSGCAVKCSRNSLINSMKTLF